MKLEAVSRFHPGVVLYVPALNLVLLLVFFVLFSGSVLLQPGVAVAPPASRFLLPPVQNPLVISVTSQPSAAVYFEDQAMDSGQLEVRLGRRQRESRHVIVKADRGAPFELVAGVTELALRMGFQVALASGEARR